MSTGSSSSNRPSRWNVKRIQEDVVGSKQVVLVTDDVDDREGRQTEHVQCEGDEELDKVAVVAASYAVVHPRAVMVKHLHTQQL